MISTSALRRIPEAQWPPKYAHAVRMINDLIRLAPLSQGILDHEIVLPAKHPLGKHEHITVTERSGTLTLGVAGILNGVLNMSGNSKYRLAFECDDNFCVVGATVLQVVEP